MLTFTEFLTEATKEKQVSFKKYVKETSDIICKLPGVSVKKKLSLGHIANKESANFSIIKKLGSCTKETRGEMYQKYKDAFEKMKKSILLLLNCPAGIMNAVHKEDFSFNWGDSLETQTIQFTDAKNTFNIIVKATFMYGEGACNMYSIFEFEFSGADIKSETVFVEYPEFVPGKILHSSWGYSMTINTYYEIVRRTNKTVYVVEIGKKKVDGDGWTGHEIPIPEQKGKTVLSGRIKSDKNVSIDGKHCRIWDGKPSYYNSLD